MCFRSRLVESEKSQILLDQILAIFEKKGWLKVRGQFFAVGFACGLIMPQLYHYLIHAINAYTHY